MRGWRPRKIRPVGSTILYSPTMSPLDVVSGQPDVYLNDFPGGIVGCSPMTPGPRTSCCRPFASVIRQCALHQRHRIVAEIDDLDRIAPKIAPLVRIGPFRIEGRLDGDFDLMGYGLVHAIVILAAAAPPSTASAVVFGATP